MTTGDHARSSVQQVVVRRELRRVVARRIGVGGWRVFSPPKDFPKYFLRYPLTHVE